MTRAAAAALLLALVAACGSPSDEPDPTPAETSQAAPATSETPEAPATAGDLAEALAEQVPEVAQVVVYDEDNDPNDLLGRPGGYTGAARLEDERIDCDPEFAGIDCGAVIEVWPSAEEAQERADYIQSALGDTPTLGTEYHYLDGAALLRVSGTLKPSEAAAYETAWKSL